MTNKSSVLVVGSMAFDDLELPSGAFPNTVGGSATYASLAASIFASVNTVAVVGTDFPQSMLDTLKSRGIDTAGIERADGKTFRWAGRYDADLVGRTTLDTQLNVFANFQPKIPAPYRKSDFVLLGNIHPALQLEVLGGVESPRLVVADTMNFWIQGEPAALAELIRRVDVLIINDEEARELSGIHNVRRAAEDILKRGPSTLIIKRGEHGALLFDKAGIFAVPGFPLEREVDPTGAGDSFAGGFIGHLCANAPGDRAADLTQPIRLAMVYGTATASRCVEGVGTSTVQNLALHKVEERVQQIRSLFQLSA